MAVKLVRVEGIGELTIAKRRGAKNLRLSITPKGQVRVSLPYWAPYSAAILFAKQRQDWINQHAVTLRPPVLRPGVLIGKSHRLEFRPSAGSKTVTTRVGRTAISVQSNLPFDHPRVQQAAAAASVRALRQQATVLLAQRLTTLAQKHGYTYKSLSIKKMTSRWGSCSSDKRIALSLYLIQLPWALIDYVILHELVHTRRMHHGADFWQDFLAALPDAKQRRKEIKRFQPRLLVD